MPKGFTHVKRCRPDVDSDQEEDGSEMHELQPSVQPLPERLAQPIRTAGLVYNMNVQSDRERLAVDLWRADYAQQSAALREANPELVAVLQAAMKNSVRATPAFLASKQLLLDGMLLNIVRAQSQLNVPLLSAALSILGECNKVSREYHDAIATFFKGAAMSEPWTEGFLAEARVLRPPPEEEMLPGVIVAVFDNLSMQVDYTRATPRRARPASEKT